MPVSLLFYDFNANFKLLYIMLLFDIFLGMTDRVIEAQKFVARKADSLHFAIAARYVTFTQIWLHP